jgi:transposase-like protein
MDSIEAALADLGLQDKLNISAIADKHKVKRSILFRRWNKVTRSREDGYDLMRFLSTI